MVSLRCRSSFTELIVLVDGDVDVLGLTSGVVIASSICAAMVLMFSGLLDLRGFEVWMVFGSV